MQQVVLLPIFVMFDDPFFGNTPPNANYEPLGKPNSPAGGTPLITGRIVPGEYIEIDVTSIWDGDNFGVAPSYHYAFSLSSDDGLSWVSIPHMDSPFLQLTTSLLGGLVRGTVFFRDGMGNNEFLNSDAVRVGTGTPTLSGTLKAGQTITIDKTPVQDADNFTGYTPTFTYNWESSTDGTTWSKLTSTDATDNNSTYTLTTEEVGKKVRGVVSYLDGYGTNEVVPTAGSSVTSAAVVRGNSLYTIVDGPSWTQAEANSVKLGGHLVTINNKAEEDVIYNSFGIQLPIYTSTSSPAGALWIGLTDNSVEGLYKWVSGDTSNWFEAEYKGKSGWIQNSDSSQQDFMILRRNGTVPSGYDFDDYWLNNSSMSGTSVTAGIAETPFIRRGDSAYVIVQGPTWEEAESNAVKLGGHLVTINDAAENDFLTNSFQQSDTYYIGFSDKDKEGAWVWNDGSDSTYDNWLFITGVIESPETNPGENFGFLLTRDIQDTPHAWRPVAGKWAIGHSFLRPQGFLGIAEIKLVPNNPLSGTPTLSGTTKVGQVITIDKTPIQDADNFTGYTLAYNYTFEVSNDNGTTWSKLTSTDATDNNSTYTLTTEEVGKKVRGVVSYLDGYGTNESVASAGSTNVIAPSNTAPTAVQTLTGSSKVGRVLSADKSTIVDPDGVPTAVSYGWEVSSNGTTWTKLTTADATDNNSTYALTAAELGKTVRSVIAYTDGFGTNETVRSAATTTVVAGNKPTNISLSSTNIVENIGPNASVATLRSVDLDTDDAFTYSLVNGPGSTDNSRFSIAGDQLVITGNPDFETKNSYSIRLRTTDLGGLTVDKSFTLKVTNVNEAPIAISLSDSDFLENISAGSVIANLSSIDLDKDTAFRAPRIIGTLQIFGGHKNAAKEAAAQENIISTIDELP